MGRWHKLFVMLGKMFYSFFSFIGELSVFTFEVGKNIFRKPFYRKELVESLLEIGYKSLPIVVTISFFTGMIMTLNVGKAMDNIIKGTSQYIGSGIMLVMVKELGPMLTAIAIISRVGAGTTAQISTMKATEQVDALKIMSISPIKFLVVPRVIGMVIMMPFISSIAVLSGVLGGMFMAVVYLDQSVFTYIDKTLFVLRARHILDLVIKSAVLGFFIGVVSCFYGMKSEGGARGVGIFTTRSVVVSVIVIVIVDYIVTYILMAFK